MENQQETERARRKSEEGLQRQRLCPVGVSRAQEHRKAGPLGSGTGETGGEETAGHLSRK